MSVDKLKQIMNSAIETSHFFTLKDIVNLKAKEERIGAYEYNGYLRCFNSVASYLKFSLELLSMNVAEQLFDPAWPIFTRTYDTPPAKYCQNADVKNCYISNGAIIDGKIENCIIGRGVKIDKNTNIKNSIVFSSSIIEEGANLENVIVDKEVRIKFVKELAGTSSQPLVIKQGDVV
jgi:glucose-1-phosphate adenylyltransferase